MNDSRLLLFAGPSGGHLFPAAAFAEEWRKSHPSSRLFLVTSRKAEPLAKSFPAGLFEKVVFWDNFPSPSGISLRSADFLIKLSAAFVDSFRLIREIHPHLSVGFGSYVSYPGVVAAKKCRIPTLIHEQNAVPGKATRWLARHADVIAVTFEATRGLERFRRKTIVTGLPVRRALAEGAAAKPAKREGERTVILVTGGSQGASFLNRTILNTFSLLSPEEKKQIAVIHITGSKEYESVRSMYESAGVECEIHPFFEKMQECLRKADIAVTRAGANTLFELALYGIPAIVIPYPYAGAHQAENAEYFTAKSALVCEAEAALTSDKLLKHLKMLLKDRESAAKMRTALESLAVKDAAFKLVETAEKLIKGKQKV